MLKTLCYATWIYWWELLPCFGKTLGWASYRKYHTIHSTCAINLIRTLWSPCLPALVRVGQSAIHTADIGLPELCSSTLSISDNFSSYTMDFAVILPLMLRTLLTLMFSSFPQSLKIVSTIDGHSHRCLSLLSFYVSSTMMQMRLHSLSSFSVASASRNNTG